MERATVDMAQSSSDEFDSSAAASIRVQKRNQSSVVFDSRRRRRAARKRFIATDIATCSTSSSSSSEESSSSDEEGMGRSSTRGEHASRKGSARAGASKPRVGADGLTAVERRAGKKRAASALRHTVARGRGTFALEEVGVEMERVLAESDVGSAISTLASEETHGSKKKAPIQILPPAAFPHFGIRMWRRRTKLVDGSFTSWTAAPVERHCIVYWKGDTFVSTLLHGGVEALAQKAVQVRCVTKALKR
jgi:hypothetical protein